MKIKSILKALSTMDSPYIESINHNTLLPSDKKGVSIEQVKSVILYFILNCDNISLDDMDITLSGEKFTCSSYQEYEDNMDYIMQSIEPGDLEDAMG